MEEAEDAIAVVGIGCNFPGGEGLDNFWKVLLEGKNCSVPIPKERFDISSWYDPDDNKAGKSRTAKAALINGFNEFDHRFFGISDSEVEQMDPQQKQLLQCVYRALENAGIPMEKASGTRTGVYFGIMNRDYETNAAHVHPSVINHWTGTGLAMSIAANRVSYIFNFTGPSLSLDCACSSSLVALHLACQSIKQGDCEMAVCGGVNCIIEPRVFVALSKAKMISPEGTSKPFSNKADGYGRGEGCGVVLLKRLKKAIQDHDHIWGIISKTAVNQDGHSVSPITKPSMTQQEELLRRIYSESDLVNVQYIEAHGTGTPVGDPTEAGSISNVIAKAKPPGSEILRIGSVKSNIGHSESAAGVAGLIKVLLMMKHETICPSVFYSEETASVDAKALNIKVPKESEKWEALGPRIAGVNNFGFGGTNAHAIVKQHKQSHIEKRNGGKQKNSQSCTLSGDADAIESIHKELSTSANSQNLYLRVLDVPAAYHSHMMDPILQEIEETIGSLKVNDLDTELFSTVTGKEVQHGDFCKGEYWARNIREPVAFEQALNSATKGKKNVVFVEIGPRRALQRNIMESLGNDTSVLASLRPEKDHETLLSVVSNLFELGVQVNWDTFYRGYETMPLPIPKYQFDCSDRDVIIGAAQKNTVSNHPVLCQTGSESNIFSCDLMSESSFYLKEHKHNNISIIPGSFYAELGLAAFMASAKPKVPLCSLQNSPEMKVQLEKREEDTKFMVLSPSAMYASGTVVSKKERLIEEQCISLSSIYKRCKSVVSSEEFYGYLSQGGFQYGDVFKNKWDVHYGEDLKEAFAKVTVPEQLRSQLHDYYIHPVVLDFLMQLLPVTVEHIFAGRPGFPAKIGSLTVFEPLQDEMVVYLRAIDVGKDHFEICGCFADKQGKVLVEVKHVIIKYLGSRSHVVEEYFYHNAFSVIPEDVTSAFPPKALVFADSKGISKGLQQYLDLKSIYVPFKHAKDILSNGFPTLLANLNITDIENNFDEVLFLWGKEDLTSLSADVVLQNLASCLEIFRQIVLKLKQIRFPNSIRAVTYCSSDITVDHISPGFALAGMTRSFAAEIPDLSFQLIDISSTSPKDIAALSEVLRSHPCSKYPELVVKDGQILKPSIVHTPPEIMDSSVGSFTSTVSEPCILQTDEAHNMTHLSAIHCKGDPEAVRDRSVEIRPIGKDVRKLKVGDQVASCYPVVAASKVRVPEDVCYSIKRFPFLQKTPCVSYFVLAWEILHRALSRAKHNLGIISSLPDSALMKVLALTAYKSGWNNVKSESIEILKSETPQSYFNSKKLAVVVLEKDGSSTPSDIPLLPTKKQLFRKRAVYIVAGGLSGLGFETVKFISQRGGEYVVILSRSKPTPDVEQEIHNVEKQCGNCITSMECDISVSECVHKVINAIGKTFPGCPIKGVFHSAVVLDDGLIETLNRSLYEKVLKPKVNGALNLHHATKHCQLDYFVCYSSISAFLGNASQTNYAAANTFLDMFCQYRRKIGLPGQSINWGALNLGLLLNKEHFQRFLEAKGMMVLDVAEIHKSLEQCLVLNLPQQVVCRFHFRNIRFNILSQNAALTMRLSALVEEAFQKSKETDSQTKQTQTVSPKDYVVSLICETIGMDKSELKDESPLSSLGIDSMQAMTLQNLIFQERGVNVPLVKLLDPNATLSTLVSLLSEGEGEGSIDNLEPIPVRRISTRL
ncbi:hypothetical protein NQZ68_013789 [Dissostichus eleginoides]|nr:hypothetical protein NQZ68_013789 [Dissostichus eleginoides]